LAEGITFEQFRKDLAPLLVQKGWWGRAEMEDPLIAGEIKNVQLGSTRWLKVIYDTNKRTGEVQRIPKGVDPSFNYPPGGRLANLQKMLADKIDRLPDDLKAATCTAAPSLAIRPAALMGRGEKAKLSAVAFIFSLTLAISGSKKWCDERCHFSLSLLMA
jgi:hypothetical protein